MTLLKTVAVILAGGKSTRMGRDKLSLDFGGLSLLESAVRRFSAGFDRVIVSVGDLSKYSGIPAERVADIYKGLGPMSGLHASLSYTGEDVFLTAADMPFSTPSAALKIIELCGDNDICALTDSGGRYEPLFAYYRKSVLPQVDKALNEGRYSMHAMYDSVKVKKITVADLGGLWDGRLLLNINRPEDYEKLYLELDNNK